MKHSREQLGERARDAAQQLLAALQSQLLVPRFVDSYVTAFDRPGLKASPLRYRELLTTLSRECLLAMVAKLNATLPCYLTRPKRAILSGADATAAEIFREAFLAALARSLNWLPSDREEFQRDLDLYAQIALRQPKPAKPRKPTEPTEGPFVDRCALLLDPSMFDKARQAAGKFLVELERTSEKILASVFRTKRKK